MASKLRSCYAEKKCLLIETMITNYAMRIQLLSLITTADNLWLIKSWKFSFSSIGFNYIINISIIRKCNLRVFIGLGIMVYEQLYHALQLNF